MTLQSSGPISLQNIEDEFGGAGSISLSEYYKGGSYVPSTTIGGSIPTGSAGTTISIGNFYGATDYTPPAEFNKTVNVVTYNGNWNVRDYLVGAGWDGSVKVNLTLASTSMIVGYSTSCPYNSGPGTAKPAMIINGSFPNGLKIINNGKILGRGARGASAGSGSVFHNNRNGWPGGDAISNSLSTSTLEFVNNGYVAGGGGGGAAAAYAGGGGGAGGAPGGSGTGARGGSGQPGGTNGTGTAAGAGGGSPSGTSTPAVETGTPSNAYNWGGSDGGSGDRGGHGGTAGGGGATAIDTGSSNGIWGGGGGGSGFVLPGSGGNGGDRSGTYRSTGREGGDGGSGGNQGGTGISTYGGEDGGGGGGGWGAKGGDSPSGTGGAGGKAVTGTAINFTGTGTEYGANG